MKTLNLNTIQKETFAITLNDEAQTTLHIMTPTKAIVDELINIQEQLQGENSLEGLDSLYSFVAKALSRNKQGKLISKAMLESIFDFEDIVAFLNAYIDFVSKVSSQKN